MYPIFELSRQAQSSHISLGESVRHQHCDTLQALEPPLFLPT
jgi:hypothetical protein